MASPADAGSSASAGEAGGHHPIKHGIFRAGRRIGAIFGDSTISATLDADRQSLWVVDRGCAQNMTGALVGDRDIEPSMMVPLSPRPALGTAASRGGSQGSDGLVVRD